MQIAGAGTRWGHGGDQVGPGGDPVGTRWGQVGTTWGPPGGDQVETSRGGDQVGTRWLHGGDQVGPKRALRSLAEPPKHQQNKWTPLRPHGDTTAPTRLETESNQSWGGGEARTASGRAGGVCVWGL